MAYYDDRLLAVLCPQYKPQTVSCREALIATLPRTQPQFSIVCAHHLQLGVLSLQRRVVLLQRGGLSLHGHDLSLQVGTLRLQLFELAPQRRLLRLQRGILGGGVEKQIQMNKRA